MLPPLPLPHRRQATLRYLAAALPPPPRRRQAAADVTMSRCPHRRSHRAVATALPPLRCAPPPRFVLLPPPLTLTPPQRHRQAATNIALSRCRHRLAATKLPPTSRCRAATTAAAAAALPFVRWLLLCCTPFDFFIACRHGPSSPSLAV
jgi:hypothetical protein